MKASTRRGLEHFKERVLPYSARVTSEDVDAWIGTLAVERTPSSFRSDLPSHPGPLRLLEYQTELRFGASSLLENASTRALISLPTGAGKTVTAVHICLDTLENGARLIVWLAPQRVLVEQCLAELKRAWWGESRTFDVVLADSVPRAMDALEQGADHVFLTTTFQSMLAAETADAVLAPELLVADECHYLERNEFGNVLQRMAGERTAVFGLTATPGRNAEREFSDLAMLFDESLLTPASLGKNPVERLRSAGVYADVEHRQLTAKFELDTERLAKVQGRRQPQLYSRSPGRLDSTVEAVSEIGDTRRVIVFCHSVAQSHVVAAGVKAAGLAVGVLASELPTEHNRLTLAAFQAGTTPVLVNAKYAAVGTDLPKAEVAVLTIPVGSPILYEQIVGRVSRGPAVGGTSKALLLDFDNHPNLHGGVLSYARFLDYWPNWKEASEDE